MPDFVHFPWGPNPSLRSNGGQGGMLGGGIGDGREGEQGLVCRIKIVLKR